jgi:hypothetical protein
MVVTPKLGKPLLLSFSVFGTDYSFGCRESIGYSGNDSGWINVGNSKSSYPSSMEKFYVLSQKPVEISSSNN